MIDEKFIFLSLILNIAGTVSYLLDTIKGKVRPNRVTWFLWSLAPLIAFSAEIKQGVGLAAWFTFITGFNPLMIFLASFINKKSVWKINKIDIFCGAVSLIGLVLWQITRIGNLAIVFSIIADFTAAMPTLAKSFNYPETENYKAFLLSSIGASITLLTIKNWDFAHYGFPAYILSVCLLLVILIRFKAGLRLKVFFAD